MNAPRLRSVTEDDIRHQFNLGDYARRTRIGELRQHVEKSRPVPLHKCAAMGLQPGTRSQRVAYYDGDVVVAKIHQYLQPDGTLGASQIPDPKELLVDGEIWFVP